MGHAQHPRYSLDKNYAHLIWRSKPIDNTENALTEKVDQRMYFVPSLIVPDIHVQVWDNCVTVLVYKGNGRC